MIASWICLPSGRCQFNGTETLAHCNCLLNFLLNFLSQLFQAIPPCLTAVAAAAPDPAAPAGKLVTRRTWLPSAGVVAVAGDANGSAAATTPQIAMSMSRTLRILPPALGMPGTPSIDLFLTNCLLNHDQCQQILSTRAPAVQAYLQCPIDRGPRLRERLSGPRHCGERVHGSVERRATHRLAARGPHTWAATAKTASSAALMRLPMCMPPHPSPDQPRHLSRTITSACPPRADQVVCHGLSRSLADSLPNDLRQALDQIHG